ncbi:hypothetical protein [Streptomyces sp. NPDC037389]|uniref:hypothetical protein n=1 Tax=Streptomyces sp. NPDC037389 TaxID=3155369 RepID=UPI0033F87CD8
MSTGKVEEWNPGPDRGFIRDDGGDALDFSSHDIVNLRDKMNLQEGDKVKYAIEDGTHATAIEKT